MSELQKKIGDLTVGQYIRHPWKRKTIMRVDSIEGVDVLVRNKDDANEFLFLPKNQYVQVVTI